MSTEDTVQDPKSLLIDLAKEVDGKPLEDTFKVGKFQFRVWLPNEEEMNWCYRYINPANLVTVATSMKLPNLSISIRSINGLPVEDFFEDEWAAVPEGDRLELLSRNSFSRKYFTAEHLMQFLGQRPPEFVQDLWKQYEALAKKRTDLQGELKNSSGEASETEESESLTETSPLGEPLATAAK